MSIPSKHQLKHTYQLYRDLLYQRRFNEIKWRLSRYRYLAFTLLALITLVLPWCTFQTPRDHHTVSPTAVPTDEPTRQLALSRTQVTSFREAKKLLFTLYQNAAVTKTFYCGCDYHGKTVNLNACRVTAEKYKKRLQRIEWEHIAPISWLGDTLPCWKKGGRKYCGQVDPFYQRAEADLHNLVPAIGAINAARSNYPFVPSIAGERREWGSCDIEIEGGQVEPPEHRKGDVARAILYMHDIYGMPLTQNQFKIYQQWHQIDPPTTDEKRIHDLKAQVQGNHNPYYEN